MPYDRNLDKTIWETNKEVSEGSVLVIGVYSYDEGEQKVGFKRQVPSKQEGREFSYRKLGRVNKTEARLMHDALTEALKNMD